MGWKDGRWDDGTMSEDGETDDIGLSEALELELGAMEMIRD